ncbi:MAG TPA: hypothetical protein PLR98_12830 [Chitinophagaceae bacterium]|nr:hypothetical protein [Chitinophagaceae bacterium]
MKKFSLMIFFFACASVSIAQQAPEGLFIASKAPDFKAKDQKGEEAP